MATVIRSYDVLTGKPLPGTVTIDGTAVTAATPTLTQILAGYQARARTAGKTLTLAQAARALDGYCNGRVLYASKPPAWLASSSGGGQVARGLGWAEAERAGWNPGLHPRGPHGQFAHTAAAAAHEGALGGRPHEVPLRNAETWAESADHDTVAQYVRPDGTWEPRRAALHEKIIASVLAGHHPSVSPSAVFLGGGPAAGKSTVSSRMPAADVVHADPDQIISRLPEYQAGGKDSAAAVHYESAYLGRVVTARALHQRLNVLVDGTGNSSAQVMAARLTEAHAAGHHVIGRYVTVPTDEAVRRARLRGQQTGRYVPEQAIRGIHASVSRVFSRLVAQGLFDEAELWDNSGPEPALIGHQDPGGKWVVTGHEAWRRFLAKGTGRG